MLIMVRPGGLLSEEEQVRLTEAAVRLLQHVHAWGSVFKLPPLVERLQKAYWSPEYPRPADSTHALLQLLARLTKRHSLALKVELS